MTQGPYAFWKAALPAFRLDPKTGHFSAIRGDLKLTLIIEGPQWRLFLENAQDIGLSAYADQAVPELAGRVRTGDPEFDQEIVLVGELWDVLAVDSEVRLQLSRLVRAGASLTQGRIAFDAASLQKARSVEQVEALLLSADLVLAMLAKDPTIDPVERVINRLETEPSEAVRRRIELALEAHRHDPRVVERLAALKLDAGAAAGASDEEAFAQLAATMSRRAVVVHLLQKRPAWGAAFLLDRWSPEVIAQFPGVWLKLRLTEASLEPHQWARLVHGLISMPRTVESERLLNVVLKRCRGDALEQACDLAELRFEQVDYEGLIRVNPAPEFAHRLLQRMLVSVLDDQELERAMTVVASCCDSRSQGQLLEIAQGTFRQHLRVQAIHILGQVATPHVLGVLAGLTTGLFRSEQLKRGAAAAIDAIRQRHPVADAGALSVSQAVDADGALSTTAQGGDLSITD